MIQIPARWASFTIWLLICSITGSSLALHCCKAHAKINRKIKNLTPCKIVTNEDFNLKLGIRDYVVDIMHHATFGPNRFSGAFPPKFSLLWFFVMLSFFLGHVPRSNSRTDSYGEWLNDVLLLKDGPFGGRDDEWRHMRKIFPKTPQKGVWIGSFKPKLQNLYIAISLELLIQWISGLRTEFRPRKALYG